MFERTREIREDWVASDSYRIFDIGQMVEMRCLGKDSPFSE